MRGIAQQIEIQFVFGSKALQQFKGIGAYSYDDHSLMVELCFCVSKLGRFNRSTRCIRFGVKEKQNALAFEISERNFFSLIRRKCEIGGFFTDLEHDVLVWIRVGVCEAYR
jgi:hypothetical protein